ncbi:MAG: hypothetical protein P1P88_03050 [Bacteroidales bacterium]|nr:hypothetical protein [Bacteroidales bacterium]
MARTNYKDSKLLRKHKMNFLFNEMEKKALESYCKKYKIENRSKFMREAIVTTILQQFDKDYPSLFDQLEKEKQPKYEQGVLAM